MSRRMHGYLYLTLAMITVGSTVVASKIVAAGLPPFTATALRFAIALPLFLVLMRVTRITWPILTPREWGLLLVQAGAGSVGYTTLLILGLRHASATDAGVIIGTLPVVSAAIAIMVLGERPRRAVLLAIALAAAGVLTIVFRNDAGSAHSLLGSLLIFGAVGCEGVFILLNKRIQTPIAPLALSTIMAAFGLAVAVIPAGFEMPWMHALSGNALAAVAYYALIPTVGGFLLWYAGAARVSGAEAALFTAVAPVSAVVLAAALLGEQIGQSQIIGIGCVLVAVFSLGMSQSADMTDSAMADAEGDAASHR
ncbi:DMT family transporter [Cupriavidus metallidurans]|uniref:DMT family transporter n=1 Tax=Cupriavidus metallidurans TaxID=119219 RepID=UPI001CCF4F1B|nr:DMT family transporter [Cupriavidus metallidurans]UBM11041.1 DMT family transporter [Cupriavidus metallidurans]